MEVNSFQETATDAEEGEISPEMEPEPSDDGMKVECEDAMATSPKKVLTPKKRFLEDPDYSDVQPLKQLCRFYYLDQCLKNEECTYMHSEFPCKFYYFGYECKDGPKCKLRHGAALSEDMQQVLWTHINSAPAKFLQRFPCFPHVILKSNFDDRHNELLQMEQEGLFDGKDCGKEEAKKETNAAAGSGSLLSEVIKTASISSRPKTRGGGDVLAKFGDVADFLTAEQIVTLAKIGIETMEQLFQMGASSLLMLGFDYDTLVKIGNCKEAHKKKSIYNGGGHADVDELKLMNASLTAELDPPDVLLPAAVGDEPALTDQELLSILYDDLNGGSNQSSTCEAMSIVSGSDDPGEQSGLEISNEDSSNSGAEERESSVYTPADSGSVVKPFNSDAGSEIFQLMLYSSVKAKETDPNAQASIQRTIDQLKKADSLLTEELNPNLSWASSENSGSRYSSRSSSRADSLNQSFGSDSDSQTVFRMPFKSIIDRYTPATEIDASNGKFPTICYRLTPIDVPVPNFDRIRHSFVTRPTHSSDPRIQIMFNIGPVEKRPTVATTPRNTKKASSRDPRLKKPVVVTADQDEELWDSERDPRLKKPVAVAVDQDEELWDSEPVKEERPKVATRDPRLKRLTAPNV